MTRQREEHERDPMAKNVRHQFELLVLTNDRLESEPDETSYESKLERAAVETAYLVALRTIIAFFDNDPGKCGTGMIASDYCTAPPWDRDKDGGRALQDLQPTRSRINERVAHIDVERLRNRAQIARRRTVWKKIDRLMARFADRTDAEWKARFYTSLADARHSIHTSSSNGPPDKLSQRNS